MQTAPSSTVVIDTMSPAADNAANGLCPYPRDRGTVDELVDLFERDGFALRERCHQRRGSGGFDTQHRCRRGALGQVGSDSADAATTADRHDDQIGFGAELFQDLHGDGALSGHRAEVVIGRYQRCAGAGDIGQRRFGGHVIGLAAHDQLDEVAAVIADPVALLLGRLRGNVDPAVDAHRPAGQRETLCVVTRRRAHHARGLLIRAQLHQ